MCVHVHMSRLLLDGIVPSSGHGPTPTSVSSAVLHSLVSPKQAALGVGPSHHICFNIPHSDTPDERYGMLRRGRPATTASVGSPRLALLWHQGDVSQQMLMLALGLGESDHDLFLLPHLVQVPHTQQTIADVLCLSALQGHASFLDSCLTYSVHSSRLTTVLCFVFVFVSEVVSHVTRAGLDPPAATLEVLRL